MTLQEAIKAGNHEEIKRIGDAMDKMRRMDINQKLFIIKVYLICKAIAIIGIGLILIKLFN